MTNPPEPWPDNAAHLLRLLVQRVIVLGKLPRLIPRALHAHEIIPGRSEFCVTDSTELDSGSGWDGDFLVLPREYGGYIAVHYAQDTDQRETFPDEARLASALATFTEDARVRAVPGLRQFGLVPARWFLNDTPVSMQHPPVLTLEVEWTLGVNLLIPRAFLNPDATGGVNP
ncbi:hypothetical protein [Deinococcus frigens]|uniref:hypothetical protein n=1 Tax=Deinococcus frigens TaxID=249403 RepID=UPI0004954486|nr:hypothetical protein [Deinococcus frigens]